MVFKKGHKHSEKHKGKIVSEKTKYLLSIAPKHVGNHLSPKTIARMSRERMGNKNPAWKGDEVKIDALHNWIRRHKPKPELCECCKREKPYDVANISQKYKRDINDFEWLCRRCHLIKDERLFKNLKNVINKKEEILLTI